MKPDGEFEKFFHETVKIMLLPKRSEDIENGASQVDAHLAMFKARNQAERKGVEVRRH